MGEREAGRLERDGVPDPTAPQEINPATGLPTGRRVKQTVPVRTKAPPIKKIQWTNKRTGEVMTIPEGIDPGWDHNAGIARKENLGRMLAGKVKTMPLDLAEVARKDLESSAQFEPWMLPG